MNAQDLAGLHAANKPFAHIPGAIGSYMAQLEAGRMSWAKLMFPEHRRADALMLKQHGYKIIVRAPGEGQVYASDVRLMLLEFQGIADYFEIGNEPASDPDSLWKHAWFMAYIAGDVLEDCQRAGIRLCTPGWTGNAEPPARPPDNRRWDEWGVNSQHRLNARLLQVYGGWKSPDRLRLDTPGFDAIGTHVYGTHVIEQGQIDRLLRWQNAFPKMPILITEAGIAARDLVGLPSDPVWFNASEQIKAQRYANFTKLVAEKCENVVALIWFMASDGTPEWGSFNVAGEYAPNGAHGYYLGLPAWQRFGEMLP